MELRAELLPALDKHEEAISRLLRKALDCIDDENYDQASAYLNELNSITGRQYEVNDYMEYWSWTDVEDIIEGERMKLPKKVADISKEELIEIVNRARSYDQLSIHEIEFYVRLFEANVTMNRASELIRNMEEYFDHLPSSEEIVEKALSTDKTIYL